MMELRDIRIEYRENPIGIDIRKPRFSWILKSKDQNVLQTAYQVVVTKDAKAVWDSGKQESNQSILIKYEGMELEPNSLYHVNVKVWDNKGNHASGAGFFETGLLGGIHFSADWISHDFPAEESACPVFLKEFKVKKEIQKARIYASALGIYEIKINGKKVGDSFFTPGWTNYHKRLQYQTYAVDNMIQEQNDIEIVVGNGWYKGILGHRSESNHYGDKVAVLVEIHLTYSDNTTEIIRTDESWKVTTGSIRSSEIYMGEVIDSCFKEGEVRNVVPISFDNNRLIAQEGELVRITEKITAKEFFITPKGEKVIDFGQNLTGFVEVRVKGNVGQKITIRHAEVLDKHGNFCTETLRLAKSVDEYICNGADQTFLPHFTFHGFRYICIEGMEEVNINNFTACVLHTDMEETGLFRCSDSTVSQLQSNISWSQKGNFLDIPTDCPQRDERLGWTGDAQVFAPTAAYNMNVYLFFRKWLHDLASEQTMELGVPHVVPNLLGEKEGAAAWGDAATIIPWVLYETYGDIQILEEQYESMKDWIEYIISRCGENGLWQSGYQYGDWLALDKEDGGEDTGSTDRYLVANAFYAYSTNILAKTAGILKKTNDAKKYADLYKKVKRLINDEYITKTGRMVSETQTACVLALYFNIAEEEYRDRILESLKTNIKTHKNHLSTGFVGTPYLCHTLTENNLHDLAGIIFLQEDYPSWLYPVKKGATTIWERWDSIKPDGEFNSSGMNSLNHYAYGSIGDWMYRQVAGINQLEPGYKKILIKPQFIKGITFVDATYKSVYGEIRSAWSCENNLIKINIEIPANTTAVVYLPEKDKPLELGSGRYEFEYPTETNLEATPYSLESTVKEIFEDPLGKEILSEYAPDMVNSPEIKYVFGWTLNQLLSHAPDKGMKNLFQMVIDTLNKRRNQMI
jgi:alpha-L-rhamnosidase